MMKIRGVFDDAWQFLFVWLLFVITFVVYLAATPDSVNGDGEDVAQICEEVRE